MCHLIVFSTTSEEDFSSLPYGYDVEIRKPEHPREFEAASSLPDPMRWVISRFGGCGCHFRHDLEGVGFEPPADWMPEDSDNVEATGQIYDLAERILKSGHRFDVLDIWEGSSSKLRVIEVDLGEVPRSHFRFMEGFLVKMRTGAGKSKT